MLIACLGWGSLVWDPRELPVRGRWFLDGPFLPIEFARQSDDGRITLVLVSGRPLIRSLWSIFSLEGVDAAREALGKREGIRKENVHKHIGVWNSGQGANEIEQRVATWAKASNLDAVIWTSLPPKFKGEEGPPPSTDQVVQYLSDLRYETRKNAERYVRMAPRQIDTDCRRRIETQLGWTPLDPI